jgi:hypothetical protein
MPKLSKKERLKKQAIFLQKKAEWDLFRGLCNFFGLNIEEIYELLKQNSNVLDFYPNFHSFSIAVVQRPVALMNKEECRDAVIVITSELNEDAFICMNNPIKIE